MTKVIEKNYQTLDFISLEARYRDGRTATLMVSLLERSYSLEIVGLNGKNGAGKSTLMKMMAKSHSFLCADVRWKSCAVPWKNRGCWTGSLANLGLLIIMKRPCIIIMVTMRSLMESKRQSSRKIYLLDAKLDCINFWKKR